jgi:hypothetical protein
VLTFPTETLARLRLHVVLVLLDVARFGPLWARGGHEPDLPRSGLMTRPSVNAFCQTLSIGFCHD